MTTQSDGAVPNMIILKTSSETFPGVVKNHMHALNGQMRKARPGDLLLLAVRGQAIVTHAMRLKEQASDDANQSLEIWRKSWPFIVKGDRCWPLDRPFNPHNERVTPKSQKDYGRGGTLVYVDPRDAEAFVRKGLLSPLLPLSHS